MKYGVWSACLVLMLGACQPYSLQKLRNTDTMGSPFHRALAKEYMQLAAQEELNYDWGDSWHFADKGLTAAYGNDIGPENLEDWNIPEEALPDLERARNDLITVLKPGVVAANPELAARAYRYFDCWVERQEDAWELEKIAECRQGFEDTLASLGDAPSASVAKDVDTTSYIVFFNWNSSAITKSGRKVLADVIDSLAKHDEGYEVVLNGHTDATGLEKFNLTLSKKRAETVASALEAGGVAKEAIKIFAFGESDPRVPTPDGAREPRNRRVEIFIQ